MPTIAEAWIQKGIKKGITEGKEEDAKKMIELGMSNSDIRKLREYL